MKCPVCARDLGAVIVKGVEIDVCQDGCGGIWLDRFELNDRMESKATGRIFPHRPPCSSTKSMTGHTLGAAGAMELAFCWLTMNQNDSETLLPPHIWDQEPENGVPLLNLIPVGYRSAKIHHCMSNSYAFGGCNVSLIITREEV